MRKSWFFDIKKPLFWVSKLDVGVTTLDLRVLRLDVGVLKWDNIYSFIFSFWMRIDSSCIVSNKSFINSLLK